MNKDSITIPQTLCFRVTRACNLSCPFCQAPPIDNEEMSLDEVKECIDIFSRIGIESIKFTGGEPYIRKDFEEIIQYTSDSKIVPIVCTNGTLLNQKKIDLLKSVGAKVKISLHGYDNSHNAFTNRKTHSLIEKNVKKLLDNGVYTSLHTIVTKNNISEMDSFIEYWKKLNLPKISLIGLIERGREKENNSGESVSIKLLEELAESNRKKYSKDIKISVLDFSEPYYVIESDKSLKIEVETESKDTLLAPNILECKDILLVKQK